ncbi:MAG: ABC transporter permease [Candidatus Poribacteria bacterium]|nr:ABC transporter permease [Candidatus Poribacteria bacterium]
MLPAAAWLIVFFLVPLGMVFLYSFQSRNVDGTIAWTFTFDNYLRMTRPIINEFPPNYLMIIVRSIWTAVVTTFICLVVAYPFAYGLAKSSSRWRNALLLLVVIPFWTNFLIRTYAWRFLLWKNGLFDLAMRSIGFDSFVLHGTESAVVLGLVYGYLPFMILPLYVTLERLDPALVPAARDLGAGAFTAFRRVTLPLSLPGIIAGSVLVFIPSASAFVTPKLLGGAKTMMLGELVELQFKTVRDWPFGSAAGFVLMFVVLLATLAYFRAVQADEF